MEMPRCGVRPALNLKPRRNSGVGVTEVKNHEPWQMGKCLPHPAEEAPVSHGAESFN